MPLSAQTRERLDALFVPSERDFASELLVERCAENLHSGSRTPEGLERLRFAVLKLSEGDLEKLWRALDLAETDWRDLLVAAGFADDLEAHRRWWPESVRGPRR